MKKLALKNFLLVLLLFIGAGFAQAQDNSKSTKDLYLSYFGNDSTVINIEHAPCYSADLYLVLSGVIYTRDTVTINGNQYYYSTPKPLEAVFQPSYHYLFPRLDTLFLREERQTGRLYRYYRDYFGMGEAEKLICDMSLEEGDKIVYPHMCLWEDTMVVSQVNYNNGIKTMRLYNGYYNTYFKEGIFPDMFPLWQEPLSDMYGIGEDASATFIWLLCEYKDGVQVYGSNNNCFPNIWEVEEIEHKSVSIYPSIIKNNDIITIETSSHIKNVTITNLFGKTVETCKNIIDDNKWQINVNNKYEQGIYFVLVVTDNGMSYEKIILLD